MGPQGAAPNDATTEAAAARIGPNAVLQLAHALDERYGRARTEEVFRSAGQAGFLQAPPESMVDERAITALYTTLPQQIGEFEAAEVGARAGQLTGEYLLAHRIPAPAQRVMKLMPAALAARTLLAAIDHHAWTFAGSGQFAREAVQQPGGGGRSRVYWKLSVADCPLCRGVRAERHQCAYYAATFERIFREVVATSARVAETHCQALGAEACVFEVSW